MLPPGGPQGPPERGRVQRGMFTANHRGQDMSTLVVFVILAALCIVWYVVASIQIVNVLLKQGVKINWFLIRLLIPVYANQYKKLTHAQTGKTGCWFYHWVISVNGMAVFAVIAIILKVSAG
jgi:hypothetical protein